MKTFEQKLKEAHKSFEAEQAGKRYDREPLPEVYAHLLEYIKTGKYPYNSDVQRYISEKENLPKDHPLQDYLNTEVYIAQRYKRLQEEREYENKMVNDGYIPVKYVYDFIGECELVAEKNADWLTRKIAMIGKIIKAGNGEPFFVPKGKRTRGYYLRNLENGFYKPITK